MSWKLGKIYFSFFLLPIFFSEWRKYLNIMYIWINGRILVKVVKGKELVADGKDDDEKDDAPMIMIQKWSWDTAVGIVLKFVLQLIKKFTHNCNCWREWRKGKKDETPANVSCDNGNKIVLICAHLSSTRKAQRILEEIFVYSSARLEDWDYFVFLRFLPSPKLVSLLAYQISPKKWLQIKFHFARLSRSLHYTLFRAGWMHLLIFLVCCSCY